MTKASDIKRVRRETDASHRWRPLVVEIGATTMRIRQKGRRHFFEVDYESVFSLAAKKEAQRIREEKKQKRKLRG